MDTLLSSIWVPGPHLPVHITPRCYAKPSCSRRNAYGSLQPTRLSPSAIGQNSQLSMKILVIHVGESPFCKFLQTRMVRDRKARSCFGKRRLCTTSARPPLPVTPSALSSDQEEHQERQRNSAEREVSSSFTQIAPYCSRPGSEVKDWKSTTDEGYEIEIIHREILSRLKAVEVATAHKNHWAPASFDPDHEPLRSAGSPDILGNSLAVEDEEQLLPLKRGRPLREAVKKQVEHNPNQRRKETRRSVLTHCLPPLLDKLGFQFPPQIVPDQQSSQRAARVNVTVSYQMSYVLERTGYSSDAVGESHSNIYHPSKAAVLARSVDYRRSSRETAGIRMSSTTSEGMTQTGWGQSTSRFGGFRSGRVVDLNSHLHAGRGGTLRYRSRVPVPGQNGSGRRLWLRAASGVEPAGNLFKDLLTIVGLVAFVVYGTYAFAMSQQYLKTGNWFRKISSESVAVPHSAPETEPKPPNLNQTNVPPDVTDENFVDTIKRRPTFVLFYANWCPYCQKLDPTWNALGDILRNKGYDVQLAKMNAEMHPNTAKNFKVVKYPTLILFKGGVAADNYMGPRTVNALIEFLDANLRNQC